MSGEGLIVVGVDGSEPARIALDFALEEAAQRAARVLLVVTAVQPPEYWALNSGVIVAPSNDQLERLVEAAGRATRETVAEAIRDAGSTAAAVPVETLAVRGNPAKVLLDQAAGADLLVVGHRGRGAIASACLGSVSLQCVLYTNCPVVVVRRTRTSPQPGVLREIDERRSAHSPTLRAGSRGAAASYPSPRGSPWA
jgi:nucleotide-binding universal stress UspA family protein